MRGVGGGCKALSRHWYASALSFKCLVGLRLGGVGYLQALASSGAI